MSKDPVRVLHILGKMDVGGAETWLMNMLRTIPRSEIEMDFLVHSPQPGIYDEEIKKLGARVIICRNDTSLLNYMWKLGSIIESGKYNVVHSHVHYFSGITLLIAFLNRIPIRIAHSHTDSSENDDRSSSLRRKYLSAMRLLIDRFATHGIAVSERAGTALFAKNWNRKSKYHLIYCGIDLSNFKNSDNLIRKSLEIEKDALVVGHVGRFVELKNHTFLIEIFIEILNLKPDAYLILIGTGELENEIKQESIKKGISNRVRFLGLRPDVHNFMTGLFNAFVLPSFLEGLPLVAIEAQAAGLPTFLSDAVSPDANEVKGLVHYLPLEAGAVAWAEEIIRYAGDQLPSKEAVLTLEGGRFDIRTSVKEHVTIYNEAKR